MRADPVFDSVADWPAELGRPVIPPFSLADEACRWFDDAACHQALSARPLDYLAALQADLQQLATGRLRVSMPAKLLFADSPENEAVAGDFRVMPCVVRGPGRLTKTVKIVGSNFVRQQVPGRMTVGRALCLDPVENHVAWEFAAFVLSSARTGAVAALAHRALALPHERHVTLHGCGAVGWYSAFFLAADQRADAFCLIDPDHARRDRFARALLAAFPQLELTLDDPEGAHQPPAAQTVVIAATDSRQAFLHPQTCRARLVISLGADADGQSELDPAWAKVAKIHLDHVDSALIGDLRRWQTQGLIDPGRCLDLCALTSTPESGRDGAGRHVFVSTGSALFDNLSIHYLLQGGFAPTSR